MAKEKACSRFSIAHFIFCVYRLFHILCLQVMLPILIEPLLTAFFKSAERLISADQTMAFLIRRNTSRRRHWELSRTLRDVIQLDAQEIVMARKPEVRKWKSWT